MGDGDYFFLIFLLDCIIIMLMLYSIYSILGYDDSIMSIMLISQSDSL